MKYPGRQRQFNYNEQNISKEYKFSSTNTSFLENSLYEPNPSSSKNKCGSTHHGSTNVTSNTVPYHFLRDGTVVSPQDQLVR